MTTLLAPPPDTPACRAALEVATDYYADALLHHCLRSWVFARALPAGRGCRWTTSSVLRGPGGPQAHQCRGPGGAQRHRRAAADQPAGRAGADERVLTVQGWRSPSPTSSPLIVSVLASME
jgi:hypothetical protein